MPLLSCHISMSLDGYAAGPNQSLDEPLGKGGEDLHQWMFRTAYWRGQQGETGLERMPDDDVAEEITRGFGAFIMGRNMFGGGTGPWDEAWHGWWGENPPYHAPVFVITHHPREPLVMQGGTTFTFVTDGIESALAQARAAAGEKDISIGGGANVVQQYLRAGLLDELNIALSPIVLGAGERLLDNIGDPTFEQVRGIAAPHATHVKYRVVR